MSVKMYTTPSCSYCKVAKSYLRERGVRFNEYDISRDSHKAEEMFSKTRQYGVPVIDVNGKVIVGFDKVKLDHLLHRQ